MDFERLHVRYIVAVLPAFVLIPILGAPMPTFDHPRVAVAGYFQSLAVLRDGAASYTYLTPYESGSALHLHSLLSVPVLAVGWTPAGRIISYMAAVAAALLVVGIGHRLFDTRVGALAPGLLWAHPLFTRFATRWWPEALGIALTVGAVYAALRSVASSGGGGPAGPGGRPGPAGRRWYALALMLLALGITNHLWEASIALPLAFLYARCGAYSRTAGVVAAAGGTLLFVEAVKFLQPDETNLVGSYSVVHHPDLLFSTEWLFHGDPAGPTDPFAFAISWTVPLSVLACIFLTRRRLIAREDPTTTEFLLVWFASGLAILVALPRGWRHHDYYLWALLVPLALSAGVFIASASQTLASAAPLVSRGRGEGMDSQTLVTAAVAVVVASALIYGATFETMPVREGRYVDAGGTEPGELVRAGRDLAATNANDRSQIVFVGRWDHPFNQTVRVLIYGRVPVEKRELRLRFADSHREAGNCDATVVKRGRRVTVVEC